MFSRGRFDAGVAPFLLISSLVMVLVASKDKESVRLLAESFETRNWELKVAHSDAEIFERLAEDYPDFLILDLETTDLKPGILVSIIHYIAPALRVIALTGHSTLEDAAVIEKGVFYYTTKPVEKELVELIQKKGGI